MSQITISRTYPAPPDQTFEWFVDSTNYTASPMVARVTLGDPVKPRGLGVGSRRTIYMLAGIYREQITEITLDRSITYRVESSVPPVIQDFTQVRFSSLPEGGTRVEWEIHIDVPIPILRPQVSALACRIAARLYSTVMKAASRSLG